MACSTCIVPDNSFDDTCRDTITQSTVFKLSQVASIEFDGYTLKGIRFLKTPNTIVWDSASFDQESKIAGNTIKVVQTLTADVIIKTESDRKFLGIERSCDICFLHKFKKGLSLLHGIGKNKRTPYFKAMSIHVLTDGWQFKTLPFVATIGASCSDDSYCLISNVPQEAMPL